MVGVVSDLKYNVPATKTPSSSPSTTPSNAPSPNPTLAPSKKTSTFTPTAPPTPSPSQTPTVAPTPAQQGVPSPHCIFLFLNRGCAGGSCFGWNKFRGNCYRYFQQGKTKAEAEAQCSTSGAHLVRISSTVEMQFVSNLMSRPYTWSWIENSQSLSPRTPVVPCLRLISAKSGKRSATMAPVACRVRGSYVCKRPTADPGVVPQSDRAYMILFPCAMEMN